MIDVVSWPAPLHTNPVEARLAESLGHLAPAPHAIQAFWWMARAWEINEPLHEQGTGAAENAPVLQDSAPRR